MHGEQSLGKGEATPPDLHELCYARRLLADLGLPEYGNLVLVADCIRADAQRHGITKAQSFDFIREQALADQAAGWTINRFYFSDARYRRVTKTAPTPVVMEWRIPANLDKAAGEATWKLALSKLAQKIESFSFDIWLKPTRAAGVAGTVLYVKVPTRDFLDIEARYADLLAEILPGTTVRFVAPTEVIH